MSDFPTERHYSIPEIAALWHLSDDTVRKHFRDVVGVLKLGHADRPKKRKYVTLLIPESVLKKVHAGLHGTVSR